MSDGIGAKILEVIASHRDIRNAPEADERLLSGIAAPMLIWLCTQKQQYLQLEKISPVPTSYLNTASTINSDTVRYRYEKGNYNGNEYMAEVLLNVANTARNIYMATLFEQITIEKMDKKKRKAEKAKENKEAHANYTRETAFHRAAKDGDTDEVKKLLNNPGIDPNKADESGMTPLHHAVEHGHSAVVELLVADRKVKINIEDCKGKYPTYACCRQSVNAAKR
ncbi:hypothetical protein MY10362_005166 [Beauveria mimosiformis]